VVLPEIVTSVAVIEPVSVGDVIVGPVNVLLVNVSVPARVANVPVVGKVTLVAPVVVNVSAFAPAVVNAAAVVKVPARETVYPPTDSDSIFVAPSTTLVPSQKRNIVLPFGIAIPEPLAVLSVAACPEAFLAI
jgi:hypothetical protein